MTLYTAVNVNKLQLHAIWMSFIKAYNKVQILEYILVL